MLSVISPLVLSLDCCAQLCTATLLSQRQGPVYTATQQCSNVLIDEQDLQVLAEGFGWLDFALSLDCKHHMLIHSACA